MIIKKYLAKTETQAIEMAKEDLGSNAVVMNIKKISPKGLAKLFMKGKVEVTAAIDENVEYRSAEKNVAKETAETPRFIPDIVADDNAEAGKTDSIEEKLNSLQKMLEKQMTEKEDSQSTTEVEQKQKVSFSEKKEEAEKKEEPVSKEEYKARACKDLIRKQMRQSEVEEEQIDAIMKEIDESLPKDAALDQILAAMYQKIILMLGQPYTLDQKQENKKETKYVFFLGSTGVGKTTTIAKIASKLKLEKNKKGDSCDSRYVSYRSGRTVENVC